MKRLRPLVLLIVLLGLGWLGQVRTGRASEAQGSRFAFADTTLLRDTLDLRFDRLFPLADSLRILPDTLRALSVRYQLSLEHLVSLADSMRVPVDSVGVLTVNVSSAWPMSGLGLDPPGPPVVVLPPLPVMNIREFFASKPSISVSKRLQNSSTFSGCLVSCRW